MPKKQKFIKSRFLRILLRIFVGLLFLFFVLVLLVRTPWGQNLIVGKAVTYLSNKIKTEVSIDRLYITFSGNVSLDGLYIEDEKGDTLIYSKNLEVATALMPLIRGTEVDLKHIDWTGLHANIKRDTLGEFNFDFIVNAFASSDSTTVDTTSQSTKIILGNIDLKTLKVVYDDKFSGIDFKTTIGNLFLDVDVFDLETLRFEVDNFEFSNSKISYIQHQAFQEEEDTTSTSTLPYLRFSNIAFENIQAEYNSEVDAMLMNIDLGKLVLELPKTDLSNNEIEVDEFNLSNTKFSYIDSSIPKPIDTLSIQKESAFNWPDWKIKANSIVFQNNEINFKTPSNAVVSSGFNPNDIQLKQFNFSSEEILYEPTKAGLKLNELSFLEHNKFQLKDLNFQLDLDDNSLQLSSLHAVTGRSNLSGSAKIRYASMDSFINSFESAIMDIELPNFRVNIQDAYYFQPDLEANAYLDSLATKNLYGTLNLRGSLDSLNLQKSNLNWGESTSISLSGSAKSVTNPDSLKLYIPNFKMNTRKSDIVNFISEDSLGISVPDSLELVGSFQGGLNNIKANAILKSSDGTVTLDGTFNNQQKLVFNANLDAEELNLGKILKNDKIGTLSFAIKTSGKGNNLNALDAVLESKFDSLTYSGYDFSKLKFNGNIKNGEGDVNIAFKDDNLDLDLNTHMILDTLNSKFKILLDLNGADLYNLGITNNDVRIGLKLNADYTGDLSNFKLDGGITEGVAVYKNQSYTIGDFKFETAIQNDSTLLKINSDILEADLKANAKPPILIEALQEQFSGYWKDVNDTIAVDTTTLKRNTNTLMKMNVLVRHTTALSKVYLPGLEEMDSINVAIDFNESQKKLNAKISAPYIKYNTSVVDSLYLDFYGTQEDLDFNLGWSGIESSPFLIDKTMLKGTLKAKKLLLDFNSNTAGETLIQVNSEVNFVGDTIHYHINPNTLVVNRKNWTIPNSNELVYAPKYIDVQDFTLTNNGQKIGVVKTTSADSKPIVGLSFDNFKLNTILSFLNPEEPIVKGVVKGVLNIEDPFNNAGLQADLTIDEFEALKVPLGKLALNASSENYKDYVFDLGLKEGNIDLDLTGNYIASQDNSKLDLELLINDLKMKAIEGFAQGEISNAKGNITGKAKLTGTTSDPIYNGNLNFNGVEMLVNQLNSIFKIDEQNLTFDNKGFRLDNFSIKDEDNNDFVLDGSILTEDFINPTFDLSLKASNFKVLNSTREDNDLFFGNVSLNTDITIKGNLEVPKIDGKLKIKEDSKFTVIVPESELDLNEREGVVIFVNRKNENEILTRKEAHASPTEILDNLDINALISVDKNSVFRIVINERTGDNLQVSGTGEFNFKMEPNGRTTLSGQYEVNNGHYEASLYNIVKRRFDISQGSKITWNGEPLDAILDIKAIYNVETSASALMATQISNASTTDLNTYRQKYPFLVYLNVEGELLSPELSFKLDMPEDEQSAAGGDVYSSVQQLNNQEEELNKQVFSLLVMNRFFPSSGSDGSAGGPASIARDNVNDVLSDQLNAFSDKILGNTGVQLDFGLDSYTDYQSASPQDRTELDINASKSLFNDRLVVQVGSEVDIQGSNQNSDGNAPVIGNVGLEYLITEDGRYRLRGYRKNKFESVIDGELIVTGISIIFNKEFNKFKELWERKVREEVAKENALKEEEAKESKEEKEKELKED